MSDLDNFFAKKDKKKGKSKSKFLTPEELAKNLEESKREAAAVKAKQQAAAAAAAAAATATADVVGSANESSCVDDQTDVTEEEWNNFVEEDQRKDYTGLKIGQMTLDDDDEGSANEGEEEDADSDGNLNADTGKRAGGNGPWKKVIPAEEVTQIPIEMEKPSSKLYISPALRHSQGLPPVSVSGRMKMRNRTAPDITNADYFPTLGAARPEEIRKKKNEPAFEEVRHGGRVQRIQEQPSTQQTSVTNRFQSLDEDDS